MTSRLTPFLRSP
ncbi:unnamed protein product, partial [Rotaria magnacalcarata]